MDHGLQQSATCNVHRNLGLSITHSLFSMQWVLQGQLKKPCQGQSWLNMLNCMDEWLASHPFTCECFIPFMPRFDTQILQARSLASAKITDIEVNKAKGREQELLRTKQPSTKVSKSHIRKDCKMHVHGTHQLLKLPPLRNGCILNSKIMLGLAKPFCNRDAFLRD